MTLIQQAIKYEQNGLPQLAFNSYTAGIEKLLIAVNGWKKKKI